VKLFIFCGLNEVSWSFPSALSSGFEIVGDKAEKLVAAGARGIAA
jgi:hypothetical protein